MFPDEVFLRRGPARQLHVRHRVLGYLQTAQVEPCRSRKRVNFQISKTHTNDRRSSGCSELTVHVLQDFWEVEKLRDELFDVSRTLHAGLPGRCHRVELPVCNVEPEA